MSLSSRSAFIVLTALGACFGLAMLFDFPLDLVFKGAPVASLSASDRSNKNARYRICLHWGLGEGGDEKLLEMSCTIKDISS